MRDKAIILLLLAICGCLVAALWNRHVVEQHLATAASDDAAVFDRRLKSVDFENIPFKQAIEELSRQSGQRIIILRPMNGFVPMLGTLVSLHLRNVRLGNALDWLLVIASENGWGWPDKLTYWRDGESIIVSDSAGLYGSRGPAFTKFYDVSELIERLVQSNLAFSPHPAPLLRYIAAGLRSSAIGDILRMIQSIDPDSWNSSDGGTIRQFGFIIAVRQTPQVHRKIAALLAELRDLSTGPPTTLPTLSLPPDVLAKRAFPPHLPFLSNVQLPEARIADLRLDAVSLPDALSALAKAAGVNIVLDPAAASIQPANVSHRITLRLRDVSLGQALDVLLEFTADEKHPLAWSYVDGAFRIETVPILPDTRIADLELNWDTLSHAAEVLSKAAGVNIDLDPSVSAIESTGTFNGIALRLHDVSLRQALDMLVECAADDKHPLAWSYLDGRVLLQTPSASTVARFPRALPITRVYDVRDLISSAASPYDASSLLFSVRSAIGIYNTDIEELSSPQCFLGCLIVTTTASNHRKIESLLASLRAVDKSTAPSPATR